MLPPPRPRPALQGRSAAPSTTPPLSVLDTLKVTHKQCNAAAAAFGTPERRLHVILGRAHQLVPAHPHFDLHKHYSKVLHCVYFPM